MKEKKIDILLAQADFWKLCFLGTGGIFLLELLDSTPDLYKLFGSLCIASISLIAMITMWVRAEHYTNNKAK